HAPPRHKALRADRGGARGRGRRLSGDGAPMAQALSLLLDRELLALNRAVGELRRRNLPIESLAVGPGDAPGQARLTVIVNTDDTTAEMTVRKLHKLSGVQSAARIPVRDGVARHPAVG